MKSSLKANGVSPSATLEITAKAKKLKSEGRDIIAFTAGEPDFNTPDFIVNSAITALKGGFTKYTPTAGIPELRKAIAEKLTRENGIDCDESNIVVSCGAKSSLYHAMLAIIDDGDEVVIPSPYWVTYVEQVKLCGGVAVTVKARRENGYKITADDLENAITDKTKLFLINSPCNPTGAVYTKTELEGLVSVCEKHGLEIISDEIYENLVFGGAEHVSVATLGNYAKEHTITVNGVSKSYAMTGWRIGYLCAPTKTAAKISALQGHTTSNIDGISFSVPDGAFYVFVDVSALFGGETNGSKEFAAKLLDSGVAVIPGSAFGDDGCIRLSYTLPADEIVEGINRLRDFIEKLASNLNVK